VERHLASVWESIADTVPDNVALGAQHGARCVLVKTAAAA